MSAGTITLTNNSAAVSGTGTAFTTDLKAGDFIVSVVGGVTYTLPVKTVNSATGVTLLKNYDGPTQAGAAWSAVPRDTMNAITAQLAAETAQALRGLNYDKQNWQLVFSSDGTITVRLPDGSTFSGPSWLSITAELSRKADKESLGTAAAKNVGTASGNVMEVGAYGLGTNAPGIRTDGSLQEQCGFWGARNNEALPSSGAFACYTVRYDVGTATYHALTVGGTTTRHYVRVRGANLGGWGEYYTTWNTTKASDGTLKAASPIVKIFSDGTFETNEESLGATVSRESVGVYRITNVLGMNSDGTWGGVDGGFDIPKDRNGQRLVWLDYEIEADGDVLVKTYHRTYPDAPAFARNIKEGYEEGDLIDIPSDQFVSVRVEMPQDSIWNLAQKAAREEMEQEKAVEW